MFDVKLIDEDMVKAKHEMCVAMRHLEQNTKMLLEFVKRFNVLMGEVVEIMEM